MPYLFGTYLTPLDGTSNLTLPFGRYLYDAQNIFDENGELHMGNAGSSGEGRAKRSLRYFRWVGTAS